MERSQQPKIVQNEFPEGFFDDTMKQAKAIADSTLRQVNQSYTYSNQHEIDEELALINAMQNKRFQSAKEEEEVDLEEILEVEDFSQFAFEEIDRIIVEPMKIEERKVQNSVLEEFTHQREVIEDTTREKIESEILKDVLSRRDHFQKMQDLKQKLVETKTKTNINNIDEGMKERKKERKERKKEKRNMMEEDDIVIDTFEEFDFWRNQGL